MLGPFAASLVARTSAEKLSRYVNLNCASSRDGVPGNCRDIEVKYPKAEYYPQHGQVSHTKLHCMTYRKQESQAHEAQISEPMKNQVHWMRKPTKHKHTAKHSHKGLRRKILKSRKSKLRWTRTRLAHAAPYIQKASVTGLRCPHYTQLIALSIYKAQNRQNTSNE